MLEALLACLDPARAPPPLAAATGHVLSFVTASDPAPLSGSELVAQLAGVRDHIMGVVPGVRLLDMMEEDGGGGDEGGLSDLGGAASDGGAAVIPAGGGGGDDDEAATALIWHGGPEVFGKLRRRIEMHRRVRDAHIATEVAEVRAATHPAACRCLPCPAE